MRLSFFTFLFLAKFAISSQSPQDTMVLSGFNYGRNLIVLNPFNSNGVGFSVTNIFINGVEAKVNFISSLFEIDFTKNKIPLNKSIIVKIVHSKTAPPKIYNEECITDNNIEIVNSLDSTLKNTNYALKDKTICILTGRLIYEEKPKEEFEYFFDFITKTNNVKNNKSQLGSPDEEGRYIGVMTYDDLYLIDLLHAPSDKKATIQYGFLVDLRGIPEDKKRGQLINLDILVKGKIDDRLSALNEQFPTRKLYFNSYTQSLMWDQDYENAISETSQALSKQISQENNLKILELEKESERNQKKYLYIIIFTIVLIAISAVFAFLRQRKLKRQINLQKTEVEEQKHLIEEKQKEVMDSIRYAKRIQSSLMPTEKYIDKILKKK